MPLRADELRQSFLDFFRGCDHTVVPSASLMPQADPTILFTNAGMNQFKRVFLGEERRSYSRAASVQRCMRAGGKHNDLENVGATRRHHTFFEMLGNFSFGDYFKEEAIRYSWDYLTRTLGLPADRLWVTVFQEDDQAFALWENIQDMSAARIVRLGHKENFWQMGETGPCGPCSEIHLDQGVAFGCGRAACTVGCDCDRYLEIWNLVFMQFDRDTDGHLHPLPAPSIDTGMGLERLAAAVQGVDSNYATDLFMPLIATIADRVSCAYGHDTASDRSVRVIADHLRAMTFMIADGMLPSNEGRGYVLRRIIRRASRHGRLLGVTEPFLYALTDAVVTRMGGVYPELTQAAEVLRKAVEGEENRFIGTLDQGLPILHDMVRDAKADRRGSLDGERIFKLYDTYGFPLDLIEDTAREHGLGADLEGFQHALDAQRDRARKSTLFTVGSEPPVITELVQRISPTEFLGYQTLRAESVRVQAMIKGQHLTEEVVEGDDVELVVDATPFYPEGGGQVGDQGTLAGPDGRIRVHETTRVRGNWVLHKGTVISGRVLAGESLVATVNAVTRHGAARNHTATHLLHAALREVLGPHVKQYGSLVTPNRLRFDFSHFRQMNSRDLEDVESLVNVHVLENRPVQTSDMGIQEATQAGALAFFGDKYGERVRVVGIGEFSKELCGGTHCQQTGEIGSFRIVSEGGVAAGVRRVEALTGTGALEYGKQFETRVREVAALLKSGPSDVVLKTRKLVAALRDREREIERLKLTMMDHDGGGDDARVRTIHGIHVHVQRVQGLSMPELRLLSDKVRTRVPKGVIALGSAVDGKVSLLVIVSKDLTRQLQAGDLIKEMAREVNGSGGGRADMAQAGGGNPEKLGQALDKMFELIEVRAS